MFTEGCGVAHGCQSPNRTSLSVLESQIVAVWDRDIVGHLVAECKSLV